MTGPFSAKPSLILSWLNSKGFGGSVYDALVRQFTTLAGSSKGTLDDLVNRHFGNLGYTGTMQDKINSFFIASTGLTHPQDAQTAFFSNTAMSLSDPTQNTLLSFSGLTFYKNYALSQTTANADYSAGSPTVTVTAARSGSAPATYFDSNGVIQTTTTANVARFTQGFYDSTGFHSRPGLLVETGGSLTTGKNGLLKSFTFADVAWTNTTITVNDAETGVGGPSATCSSLTATGASSGLTQAVTDAVAGKYTASIFIKRKTGTGTINLRANTADSYTDVTSQVGSTWTRIQVTSSSATNPTFDIQLVTSGDAVYVYGAQLEKYPWMTSFIPTDTAARTRAAETVSYVTAGNRTATAETSFIKFTPIGSNFVNDAIQRSLLGTDTKDRNMVKSNTGTTVRVSPNATDNSGVVATGTTSPVAGTSYVIAGACTHSVPLPYSRAYAGGVMETNYTAGDWTDPAYGTNFYVGCRSVATLQANCIIEAVAIYAGFKDVPDANHISTTLNTSLAYHNYTFLPAAYTSANLVSGGSGGTNVSGSDYQYLHRFVQLDSDTLIMYARIGADDDPLLPGQITRRTYTISTDTWSSPVTIYDPGATYTTGDIAAFIVNGSIWIFMTRYDRSTPTDGKCKIDVIKSTDGLTGSSFGSEVNIRAYGVEGRPNFGGYIDGANGAKYLVLVSDAAHETHMYQTTDGGITWSNGPSVYAGATDYNEAEFINISRNRIIGVFRNQAGAYVQQAVSSDNGLSWSSIFSTGIGASSGIKVQPKLIQAAGYSNRLILYFYDRGDSRLKISGPTLEDDAFSGSWLPIYLLGTASQGNGNIAVINNTTLKYVTTAALEKLAGTQTDLLYWIWKDIYNWVAQ